MLVENEQQLKDYFKMRGIQAVKAVKTEGSGSEFYFIGDDRFEEMTEFIKRNEIKTVFYEVLFVDDDYLIKPEIVNNCIGLIKENLKEDGILEEINAAVIDHNTLVEEKRGQMQSYRITIIHNGVTFRIAWYLFKLVFGDNALEDILASYDSKIEGYKESYYDQFVEDDVLLELEKGIRRERELEKILLDNKNILSISDRDSKLTYGQKLAKRKGITTTKTEMALLMDIIWARKNQ